MNRLSDLILYSGQSCNDDFGEGSVKDLLRGVGASWIHNFVASFGLDGLLNTGSRSCVVEQSPPSESSKIFVTTLTQTEDMESFIAASKD